MHTEAVDNEFSRLLAKLDYLPNEEIVMIQKAFRYASTMHNQQKRKSGEPYISHPVRVAAIIAQYQPDFSTICAALLHDVIEDSSTTHTQIQKKFGDAIADIVEGVSKLQFTKNSLHAKVAKNSSQAENFQKMTLAMAKDLRVIFVKLADRLHNMRTVHYMHPEKAKRIARETMGVYAPLAHRLGISTIQSELEDLSFRTLHPMRYSMIEKAVQKRRMKNKDFVLETIEKLEELLKTHAINNKVEGRKKHYAGIYYKMAGNVRDITDTYYQNDQRKRRSSFKDIMDIHGFRIIVGSSDECYQVLGWVHAAFKPLPRRFKDYIAVPKSNGYQSLHTTVFGMMNYPIEVQIRTEQMHEIAQHGIASHWHYRQSQSGHSHMIERWLTDIPTWSQSGASAEEFFRSMRMDLTPTEVYVFSRDGEIYALPRGATPIDFAYAIHTDVGNKCVGCTIDGNTSALSTRLENGQQVTIITNPNATPKMQWREFAVTGRALSALGVYLRTQQTNDSIALGRNLLSQELAKLGGNLHALSVQKVDEFLSHESQPDFDYVLERIGQGKILAANVAESLLNCRNDSTKSQVEICINRDNVALLSFGKCCKPVYGDAVVGLMRSDSGIVIHRRGCTNVRKLIRDPARYVHAWWGENEDVPLPVGMRVETANNRQLVAAIANTITILEGQILSLETSEKDATSQVLTFEVLVKNRMHLSTILRKLRRLADVRRISRGR